MKLCILGAGPAGVSSALYAKRANIETTIFYKETSTLSKGHLIDNYYGTPNINGEELYQIGIKQAAEIGVELIKEEVVGINFLQDGFEVITDAGNYPCDAIIIATGSYRNVPTIKNIKNFEGKGVSYCATCDGFFYRNKALGVLGTGSYAKHEADYLKNLTNDITIYTNGKEIEDESLKEFKIVDTKITSAEGINSLENFILSNGESVKCEGLFIALGSAGSVDFAKKMGIQTENNKIVVDENMKTNIDGIYACGDCTPGILQIAKAVYEGALAGSDVIKFFNQKKKELKNKQA